MGTATQPTMFETRAQAIGVKPKVLASRTKRSLESIRKQMMPLAKPWMDIDNSVIGALDDLLHAFDEFERRINESVEYLNSAPEEF